MAITGQFDLTPLTSVKIFGLQAVEEYNWLIFLIDFIVLKDHLSGDYFDKWISSV